MLPLANKLSILHVVWHGLCVLILLFFRFYPGPDGSRDIRTLKKRLLSISSYEIKHVKMTDKPEI